MKCFNEKMKVNPDQLTITSLFVLSDAFRSLQMVGKYNIVISAAVISAGNADRLYINLSCLHLQFSEEKWAKTDKIRQS